MSALGRTVAGGVTMLAFTMTSLLAPLAARAEEQNLDSTGVRVSVRIDPLPCGADCGGGLPATGLDAPVALVWIALALVLLGMLALLRRRRSAGPRLRAADTRTPYDVVSGPVAAAAPFWRRRGAHGPATGGGSEDRDAERGEWQ